MLRFESSSVTLFTFLFFFIFNSNPSSSPTSFTDPRRLISHILSSFSILQPKFTPKPPVQRRRTLVLPKRNYSAQSVLHVLERLADAAQRSTSMTRPDPPLQNTSYARYSRMLWLILVLLLLMAKRFITGRWSNGLQSVIVTR
ncbi:hypothetical protein HanRHA438_Chr07g0325341 [Helianthus annuus]|nr:hypothetical protein HanRHA438_Chr07g0325341 [Helianthus annuus]